MPISLEEIAKRVKKSSNELVLANLHLSDADIPLICEFLNNNPNITSLDIAGNEITFQGIKELSETTKINSLNACANKLGDEAAFVLAENPYLTSLDVPYNEIKDKGAEALSRIENLKNLNVSYNKISDKGVKALANSKSLNSLDITSNEVGEDGVKALVQSNSFISLKIANCFVNDEILEIISKNKSLKTLDISSNDIGDKGAIEIAKNGNIQFLDVGDNGITDLGAKALAKATNIKCLEINNNNLSHDGAESLARNKGIKTLNIGWNNIGNEGAFTLASNPSIDNLYVDNTNLTEDGIIALLRNNRLKSLSIRFNINDEDISESILEAIETNSSLTEFEYSLFEPNVMDIINRVLCRNNAHIKIDSTAKLIAQAQRTTISSEDPYSLGSLPIEVLSIINSNLVNCDDLSVSRYFIQKTNDFQFVELVKRATQKFMTAISKSHSKPKFFKETKGSYKNHIDLRNAQSIMTSINKNVDFTILKSLVIEALSKSCNKSSSYSRFLYESLTGELVVGTKIKSNMFKDKKKTLIEALSEVESYSIDKSLLKI